MKTFNKTAAQGDVIFTLVTQKIPENAIEVKPINGFIEVAHSETGHNHVMDAQKVKMFKLPDTIMECLLVVNDTAILEHLRTNETHEPIQFKPGTYHVRRQREYTPEGYRRVED